MREALRGGPLTPECTSCGKYQDLSDDTEDVHPFAGSVTLDMGLAGGFLRGQFRRHLSDNIPAGENRQASDANQSSEAEKRKIEETGADSPRPAGLLAAAELPPGGSRNHGRGHQRTEQQANTGPKP